MKIITKQEAESLGQEQKTIQGSCGGCVFGNLTESESIENCCETGRLDKFSELGSEILSVQDEDEPEKNYKIINGRICNLLRNSLWKEIKEKRDGLDVSSVEAMKKEARNEIKIPCTFIVYCGPKDNMSDEDIINELSSTLVDIDRGEIPPKEIIIVNDTAQVSPFNFLTIVRRRVEKFDIKSKWRMEFIKRPEDYKSTDIETINECIDLAFNNVKTPYYSFFYSGDSVASDYLSSIDSRLNDDLEQFLAIIPENKEKEMSGMIVQRLAHKQFYGNKNMSIIEKLNQLAEDQECKHLIKTK